MILSATLTITLECFLFLCAAVIESYSCMGDSANSSNSSNSARKLYENLFTGYDVKTQVLSSSCHSSKEPPKMLKTCIWLIFLNLYLLVHGSPESLLDQIFVKLKAMGEEYEVQIQEISKIIEDQKRISETYNDTVRTVHKLIETGEQSKLSSLYFHSTNRCTNHW